MSLCCGCTHITSCHWKSVQCSLDQCLHCCQNNFQHFHSLCCRKESNGATENEYEVLFSLTPAHLHSKERGTQTACLFTIQSLLRKLQATSCRWDLEMKKERKMAAKTVLCASKRKQNISHFIKCENQLIYLVLPLSCKALSNSLSGAWLKDAPSWGKQCPIKGHCYCICKAAFLRPQYNELYLQFMCPQLPSPCYKRHCLKSSGIIYFQEKCCFLFAFLGNSYHSA